MDFRTGAWARARFLFDIVASGVGRQERMLERSGAGLGIPTFACTPDRFPELMAAAIAK